MNPFASIKELKIKLEKKEVSAKELTSFYAARIKKYNPGLNAVLETFEDESIFNDVSGSGHLAGIPVLAKDLICQKNRITSAGSKILSNYKATYNATVIERLKDAGAVVMGRTNMDEFAMGASGEESAYGHTKNPWDITRVPGGSSSGSAAAVAAGLIPFALGTETGGSVRQPAAFCNLVGLYPTYGLHSRFGVIAFASSNDQVCPITRNVYDNALVSTVLSGHDPKDSTSIQMNPKDYTKNLDGKLPENFTLGIIKDAVESDGLDPQIRKAFDDAIKELKKLGAKIKYIDIPHLKYSNAVYFIITRAEAASNLARYDGTLYGKRAENVKDLVDMYITTRQEGFGTEVKRRILTGNYVLSAGHRDAYYDKACRVRDMIRAEFEESFKSVNLLVSPTIPTLPFKIGEFADDPITMYLADLYTVANCIIGTPALSVPCGLSKEGLPMGIQFLGPRLSEELLYKVAYAYEQSTNHHLKHPKNYD